MGRDRPLTGLDGCAAGQRRGGLDVRPAGGFFCRRGVFLFVDSDDCADCPVFTARTAIIRKKGLIMRYFNNIIIGAGCGIDDEVAGIKP